MEISFLQNDEKKQTKYSSNYTGIEFFVTLLESFIVINKY